MQVLLMGLPSLHCVLDTNKMFWGPGDARILIDIEQFKPIRTIDCELDPTSMCIASTALRYELPIGHMLHLPDSFSRSREVSRGHI